MITKEFVLKLFQAAYIQRWNDKLRPIDFIELDKHAHKLIIAYIIGRYQEEHPPLSWQKIIEGSLFECLFKIVLTDIKSPVLYAIRQDTEKYALLKDYVIAEVSPMLSRVDQGLSERFALYLEREDDTPEKRILSAASIIASSWEFDIIERADPHGYEVAQIKEGLKSRLAQYQDLRGVNTIKSDKNLGAFLNLCGQLRFQARWAHLHRIPKTSVLSHCFFVAITSYLYSLPINACPRRLYNNTFAGLFHDLPEVLTRDIIAPVKHSVEGLRDLILDYEKKQMEKIVYPLLPPVFHTDIRRFSGVDLKNTIRVKETFQDVSLDTMNQQYNKDAYDPCDGQIVKAADELSAYIEADEAIKNGCVSDRFIEAKTFISGRYREQGIKGDIDFASIYNQFTSL